MYYKKQKLHIFLRLLLDKYHVKYTQKIFDLSINFTNVLYTDELICFIDIIKFLKSIVYMI